ncbi:hypothetical protein D3C75_1326060 [compost metagenome]
MEGTDALVGDHIFLAILKRGESIVKLGAPRPFDDGAYAFDVFQNGRVGNQVGIIPPVGNAYMNDRPVVLAGRTK